jgi:hypothetical protein
MYIYIYIYIYNLHCIKYEHVRFDVFDSIARRILIC